jgi:hypothetical protein
VAVLVIVAVLVGGGVGVAVAVALAVDVDVPVGGDVATGERGADGPRGALFATTGRYACVELFAQAPVRLRPA